MSSKNEDSEHRGVNVEKSHKLDNVAYDIRGPVLDEAKRLEDDGFKILKLNSGNPAIFGFDAPDELIVDIIRNIRGAQAYVDSKGIFPARKAIMQYYQTKNVFGVEIDDIWIGNGVSELIQIAMHGLLNVGDEILVPAPDYPLWTASVTMAGGTAVHYLCDEASDWIPDLADIAAKLTPRTRGIVIINPNNPTGAVYPVEVLTKIYEFAVEHKLIIYSDEIYDKILYDGTTHVATASIGKETLILSFNGLSKNYRACGFRVGWMAMSGRKELADGYREGLNMLANMRMCSNALGQYAVQAALGGYQSINDLVLPGGRLHDQRDLAYEGLTSIPGITCVKPKGALYLFPKLDQKLFKIKDDQQMVLDLLKDKKILLVQGSGFNWPEQDHFRFVFLPDKETIKETTTRMKDFFSWYHQ